MNLFALLVAVISGFLLLACALAFLKAKDVFIMTKIAVITNCYVVPLLLLSIELEKFSLASFTKIILLILLNIVITNLLCHALLRRIKLDDAN